jgi:CRP/FNR family transcriptional regulator, cyclic AMP receptor protein
MIEHNPAESDLDGAHRRPYSPMTAIIARAAIFQTVAPSDVAVLAARLQPVHFPRRVQIYGEGEPGNQLYIITSGKVKLGKLSSDGRGHLLAVVGPSEMFGELSLFDLGPRTATATALTEVNAVVMERDVFRTWVAERPEIAERFLRVLARRLRRTDNDLSDLIFADVASRVAKQLLRLAQRFSVREDGAMRLTHDLTQTEIAQLIGTSRETVNKVFSDFDQRGWIQLDGTSMLIIELESLVRCACRGGERTPLSSNVVDCSSDQSSTPAAGLQRSRS